MWQKARSGVMSWVLIAGLIFCAMPQTGRAQAHTEADWYSAWRGVVLNWVQQLDGFLRKQKASRTITLHAVGDIMLSRSVGTRTARAGDPAAPFRQTADWLAAADLTFGNLEAPFYDQGEPIGDDGMIFKAAPETVEGLQLAGFDLLTLANNHFGNAGREGMRFTFEHLQANGIAYVGAGLNQTEAHQAEILRVKHHDIAFLGYNDIAPAAYEAGVDTPGHAWANPDQIMADIERTLREADPSFLIVTFHWGNEYQHTPSARQVELAHLAIDQGADLVVSHHPHVVQSVETYQDKLIVYSLGNFVFDQMWSEDTQLGAALEATLVSSCDWPAWQQNCKLSLSEIHYRAVRIRDYHLATWAGAEDQARVMRWIKGE